jgi:hypothetical protein
MPRQALTRITLLLPAPQTYAQFLLVTDVLTHLVDISGGVTVSVDLPPVFEGWWKPDGGPLDHLPNLLLISDCAFRSS